ncbi:hypothetical protein F8S13_12450 [Chloroflexia bacterium SDU3-3]|nr:hypothetical protein F8S13_12450 [Chloroflexia bacterium SDU3-3]
MIQPIRQTVLRRSPLAAALVAVLALAIGLGMTWALTAPPWSMRATVGGEDSALLGAGYYTKEVTGEGVAFRWTNGPAGFHIPYLRSQYIVSFRADTGTGQPYTLKLLDGQRRWATFGIQPGFRTYHVLWPAPVAEFAPAGLGAHEFTLLAEARPLREGDDRIYGMAMSQIGARDLAVGSAPIAPMLLVGLALLALLALLVPLTRWRAGALLGAAAGLPLLFWLLAWNPPTASYTWLPAVWLPGATALALVGLALARAAGGARWAALAACAAVLALFAALLVSLGSFWALTGPDYGWHLNHGGSWDRVFRAHGFYPFGFPLLLYLGQLAGGQDVLFGRAAGGLATIATMAATMGLAWRICGRAYGWLGGALLLGAPMVVAYGTLASTDAPLAGWVALALLALCWDERPTWRGAALGGLALGLGYLFRYQAMVLLAPALLWLLLQPAPEQLPQRLAWLRRAGRLALPLVCGAAFVLATAPQWLLDIRDFGRPFYTTQFTNIWVFAFGGQSGPPGDTSMQQMLNTLTFDPSLLWRHWMDNIQLAGQQTLHEALVWPFGVLALMGVALGLLGLRDRRYLLLALWVGVYTAAVTLTYNKERFFLPVMPALVLFAVATVRQLAERAGAHRWQRVAYAAASAALWCWAMLHLMDAQRELIVYLSF